MSNSSTISGRYLKISSFWVLRNTLKVQQLAPRRRTAFPPRPSNNRGFTSLFCAASLVPTRRKSACQIGSMTIGYSAFPEYHGHPDSRQVSIHEPLFGFLKFWVIPGRSFLCQGNTPFPIYELGHARFLLRLTSG